MALHKLLIIHTQIVASNSLYSTELLHVGRGSNHAINVILYELGKEVVFEEFLVMRLEAFKVGDLGTQVVFNVSF